MRMKFSRRRSVLSAEPELAAAAARPLFHNTPHHLILYQCCYQIKLKSYHSSYNAGTFVTCDSIILLSWGNIWVEDITQRMWGWDIMHSVAPPPKTGPYVTYIVSVNWNYGHSALLQTDGLTWFYTDYWTTYIPYIIMASQKFRLVSLNAVKWELS